MNNGIRIQLVHKTTDGLEREKKRNDRKTLETSQNASWLALTQILVFRIMTIHITADSPDKTTDGLTMANWQRRTNTTYYIDPDATHLAE